MRRHRTSEGIALLLATCLVAFTTMGESAVGLLEAEWRFQGEDLRRLPQFHFIARRKAGGEVRGVVTP